MKLAIPLIILAALFGFAYMVSILKEPFFDALRRRADRKERERVRREEREEREKARREAHANSKELLHFLLADPETARLIRDSLVQELGPPGEEEAEDEASEAWKRRRL